MAHDGRRRRFFERASEDLGCSEGPLQLTDSYRCFSKFYSSRHTGYLASGKRTRVNYKTSL